MTAETLNQGKRLVIIKGRQLAAGRARRLEKKEESEIHGAETTEITHSLETGRAASETVLTDSIE